MTMIWEDPAPAERVFGGSTRPKSETRLQAEGFASQLLQYPGKWARLWDADDEKAARQKEQTLRSCADKGQLKVVVRQTEHGYSVFAMAKEPSAPEEPEEPEEPQPEPQPEPAPAQEVTYQDNAGQAQPGTFQ